MQFKWSQIIIVNAILNNNTFVHWSTYSITIYYSHWVWFGCWFTWFEWFQFVVFCLWPEEKLHINNIIVFECAIQLWNDRWYIFLWCENLSAEQWTHTSNLYMVDNHFHGNESSDRHSLAWLVDFARAVLLPTQITIACNCFGIFLWLEKWAKRSKKKIHHRIGCKLETINRNDKMVIYSSKSHGWFQPIPFDSIYYTHYIIMITVVDVNSNIYVWREEKQKWETLSDSVLFESYSRYRRI